jgi:hypothetical protein
MKKQDVLAKECLNSQQVDLSLQIVILNPQEVNSFLLHGNQFGKKLYL